MLINVDRKFTNGFRVTTNDSSPTVELMANDILKIQTTLIYRKDKIISGLKPGDIVEIQCEIGGGTGSIRVYEISNEGVEVQKLAQLNATTGELSIYKMQYKVPYNSTNKALIISFAVENGLAYFRNPVIEIKNKSVPNIVATGIVRGTGEIDNNYTSYGVESVNKNGSISYKVVLDGVYINQNKPIVLVTNMLEIRGSTEYHTYTTSEPLIQSGKCSFLVYPRKADGSAFQADNMIFSFIVIM